MRFLRLTVVEMRRALHRRLVRWMIVIAIAFSAIAGLIIFLSSDDPAKFAQDQAHPARMVNWWTSGAAICGASVAGAEWRAGTMTTMLTWMPSRVRLHGARTLSAALLAFVISFLLQVIYLACAVPAVVANGTTTGTDASWWAALLLAMLRISVVTSLVAVLAVSIATIGRNTSAALVALAAWALVIERMVAGFWPRLGRFMIGENVATVVPWAQMTDVDFERPPLVALLSLLAYLAAVVAAATALFARRDVAT
jgi:hypothetical protein